MELCLKTIRHNMTLKFKPGEIPIVEISLGLDRIGAIMVENVYDAAIDCLLRSESSQTGIARRKEEAEVILKYRTKVNNALIPPLKEQGGDEDDTKPVQPDSSEETGKVPGDDEGEEGTVH